MTSLRSRLNTPVEVYALFPPLFALGVLGVDGNGLPWILKAILFAALGTLALVIAQASTSVYLLLVAVLLERSLFFHPSISFVAGVIIAGTVFFSVDSALQARLGVVLGALFTLGIFPLVFYDSSLRWISLVAVTLGSVYAIWHWARGTFQISYVMADPILYLGEDLQKGTENFNRLRLALYCAFFLILSGQVWSQAVEVLPFRLAAVFLIAVTAFLPTAVLAFVRFPYTTGPVPLEAQLVPVGPSLEEQLAAMEAERQFRERRALLEREHQFFFGQSWDQLAASFTNKLETTLPDGSIVKANDHLFLGLTSFVENGDTRYNPVLLHRRILEEHIHILGGTGSGKTSLGITPLVKQLIRGHALPDGRGVTPSEPQPIVILDIKGDLALFHTAKEEARARGQEFLFFTVDHTKSSYYFNPFQALRRHGASPSAQANQLLDALGLNHGESYGRSFFTRVNRQTLLNLLRDTGTPQSIKDLYEQLKKKPKKQKNQQGEELLAALEGLIDYPQLFTTKEQEAKEPETIIDFDRVLERNQVVYFLLTAPTQSISVREIGKLALYSFFMAAIQRYSAGKHKQSFLIIDEFQRIVGDNLTQLLEQARGYGISVTLANQNIAQLDTHDGHLSSLVNSNVRASLHFGSADPEEKKLLSAVSGEVIDYLHSVTETKGLTTGHTEGRSYGTTSSSGYSGPNSTSGQASTSTSSTSDSLSESRSDAATKEEFYRPRLRVEDLGEWFNAEGRFILWVRRGSGLSNFDGRPVKVQGIRTTDEFSYKKLRSLPWPEGPRPSFETQKQAGAMPSKEELLRRFDNFSDD